MEVFNIGDYVKHRNIWTIEGEVFDVLVRIEQKDGTLSTINYKDLELAPKPLTPEEAWLECALLIGRRVSHYGLPLYEGEKREIRRESYVLLGGNKIKVTDEVKARVRGLIDRAVSQLEKEGD